MSIWPTDPPFDRDPIVALCDDCGARADEPCDPSCPCSAAWAVDAERELDRDHPEARESDEDF